VCNWKCAEKRAHLRGKSDYGGEKGFPNASTDERTSHSGGKNESLRTWRVGTYKAINRIKPSRWKHQNPLQDKRTCIACLKQHTNKHNRQPLPNYMSWSVTPRTPLRAFKWTLLSSEWNVEKRWLTKLPDHMT